MKTSTKSFPLHLISVLVLDKDARMLGLVKDVLRDLGFRQIFTGRNGEEGLQILEKESVKLVITDWNMSPMDGIEFVRHIRHIPDSPYRTVPIILLTARAEAADVKTARDAGITEFVAKPFTVKGLAERIIAIVDKPRSFVLAPNFKGHDRRRREGAPAGGVEKRKKRT